MRGPKQNPTPRQVALAIAAQSLRTARTWRVRFPDGTEHQRRYQVAVPLSRVLADHRAAVGAEPVQDDGDVRGSSPATDAQGCAESQSGKVFLPLWGGAGVSHDR